MCELRSVTRLGTRVGVSQNYPDDLYEMAALTNQTALPARSTSRMAFNSPDRPMFGNYNARGV
ncbi:MAG TPA: hypothetical protein VF625_17785, partial [Longimicrobium sp.]